MKKILCVLMAVLSIGCLAGCVDHNDGLCDECGAKWATQNKEKDKELCLACWAKEGIDAANSLINGED